jgi:formylglycine-generating enzyme required for sulfatase activity
MEYQDASFAELTAPGKDAEEFAQVLRELAVFDDVQVLINAGEGKTRRSVARFFAERKRDDLLLLYFSGHGIRNEQGQLFLAANDTEINILEASGIPADFVTNSMNNSRSQRQLLILDCCNSGAFAHGSKSASAVGKSMGIATAFEGSGFGRVVLTATDATQYAWEGDKVIGDTQKSVFTHFLVEGLKGEADRNGDGRIDVDELYDYAYEQVVSRTPKQTPGKWSYKQQGDIVLRENLQPGEVKPAPLPPELLEMLSHPNSGVRRAGIQELISLLDGKHLGLARAAQEKLREIAESDDSLSLRRSASDTLIAHGLVFEEPVSIPVESPKKEPAAEKKIEKPARRSALPARTAEPSQKEQIASVGVAPRAFPDLKGIPSKLNLRFLGLVVGAVLVIIALVLVVKSNFFASKLGIGSTMISEKDGMVLIYVPAGEFTMGNENDSDDEKPVHRVTLDAFWIDQTEVTNAMYAKCVDAHQCDAPWNTSSYTRSEYFGNPEFDDYPVIYVSWNDAKAYCEWAGRRLPTEAEWEKAARGESAFIYPWGNDFDGSLVNFCDKNCSFDWADKNSDDGYADTAPIGSYPNGASPYGALDMAGNVWEWVGSLYQPYPYDAGDGRENLNSTDARALRGGSWNYIDYEVRSARRSWGGPTNSDVNIGFRCVFSETEPVQSAPLAQATTEIPVPTQTSEPATTNTPSLLTETSLPPTPTLGIGSTMISDKDGMTLLYVPAGEFTMGSDNGEADEKPVHTVYLDSFWIDETEVTNVMYAKCVADGSACKEPAEKGYYGNSDFNNYPVTYVDWNMAKSYCEWAGRRSPTEAEWEKAARGENAYTYPWGNDSPKGTLLNYNYAVGHTSEVGNYPDGASPYGALDMAGNVWEWVADWYGRTYYASSLAPNPLGPDSGQYRVLRGGTWGSNDSEIRSANRSWGIPASSDVYTGFRCAVSVTEAIQSTADQSAATPTDTATYTVTAEPTPIIGLVKAAEGGGAFIRERPGSKVLATIGNGATVTIVPNDLQDVQGVIWVHVFTVVNDVRVEGWMIQSVLVTATPQP